MQAMSIKAESLALVAILCIAGCGNDAVTPSSDGDREVTEQEESAPETSDDLTDTQDDTDAVMDADQEAYELADGDAHADENPEEADPYPDRSFIHELRTHSALTPTPDDVYRSEESTHYRPGVTMPDVTVNDLALLPAGVFAAADGGLLAFNAAANRFEVVAGTEPYRLIRLARSSMAGADVVALWSNRSSTGAKSDDPAVFDDGVLHIKNGAVVGAWPVADGAVHDLAVDGATVAVAMGHIVRWYADGAISATLDLADHVATVSDTTIAAVVLADDALYLATGSGLYRWRDGALNTVEDGAPFTALATCPDGAVIAGGAESVKIIAGGVVVSTLEPGPGALPMARITALYCSADALLMGHEVGASARAWADGHADYYFGLRYLPGNTVAAVALAPDGARWTASSNGISRIDFIPRTAYEKALLQHEMLTQHFWRADGFVAPDARGTDLWSYDGLVLSDSDNDGLWTQMMVGAFAFAATVCGDNAYCDQARRALHTLYMLIDVPCVTFSQAGKACGFISRSLVRDDEGWVFSSKASQPNWHPVTYRDRQYYWKDDTSSDELAGHFFGYPLFYDLCADDEEKAVIAEHVALTADYIVDNGYLLIDLDGGRTGFGVWSPQTIGACADGFTSCLDNAADTSWCADACFGGGWLNSMEILGLLLSTWHMTGQRRFYDAYEELIATHHYDRIATFTKDVYTATVRSIQNHSDHELAMLAYHTLIRYEPNDARRAVWMQSLKDFYETERAERNPLWASFVAGLAGADTVDQTGAVRSIREISPDLRDHRFDNSSRRDYVVDKSKDRFGDLQFTAVPPYDELPPPWWNGNFYQLVRGGDGLSLQGPMAYLLAYWSLRYYGLLGPAAEDR